MVRRNGARLVAGAFLWVALPATAAGWEPLGDGPVAFDSVRQPTAVAVCFHRGAPVVAWGDRDSASGSRLYVARWAGGTWERLGGNLAGQDRFSSGAPELVSASGDLYLAWSDTPLNGGQLALHVRRWSGAVWEVVSHPYPLDALRGRGVALGSGPAFPSQDAVIHFDGGAWVRTAAVPAPGSVKSGQLALVKGALWLAYSSNVNGSTSEDAAFVVEWNGAAWEPVGAGLRDNPGPFGVDPSLVATEQGEAFVAIDEGSARAFVKRWSGSAWTQVGGDLLEGSAWNRLPKLALAQGELFVAAQENFRTLWVLSLDGGAWTAVGDGSPLADGSLRGFDLRADSSSLLIAWAQTADAGMAVYARRLPLGSPADAGSDGGADPSDGGAVPVDGGREPRKLSVGCGCSAAPGAALLLALGLAAGRATSAPRRRRRSPSAPW